MASGQLIGYLCCLVASICFGSNYLPVKQIEVRDGSFFTLCLTTGIFLVGLVQWAILGFYTFHPFAMLGGAFWAIGNFFAPFIIKNIGLGLGQLVWGATNMLTGWATGAFALFGHHKDEVERPGMNYLGVGLAVITLCLFSQLKEPDDGNEAQCGTARQPQVRASANMELPQISSSLLQDSDRPGLHQQAGPQPVLAFITAFAVGIIYGSCFDFTQLLIQEGPPRYSDHGSDYVISHFTGIWLTTSMYFVMNYVVSPQKPYVGREIVFPGILSGIGWALAQVAWFTANDELSFVISFPIITSLPGIIAALWGVALFNENRGMRNKLILTLAIAVQIVGVTLIALSKGNVASTATSTEQRIPQAMFTYIGGR